jgi:hypothetical protein
MKYKITKEAWANIGKMAGWERHRAEPNFVYSAVLDVDVPIYVSYVYYRGSTPQGGPDPDSINIISAEVTKNVLDNDNNLIIPEGSSLKGDENYLVDAFGLDLDSLTERLYQ